MSAPRTCESFRRSTPLPRHLTRVIPPPRDFRPRPNWRSPRLALLVPPYPSNAQHRGWMYRNTFWGPRNIHSLVSMYFDFGRRSETPLFEIIHLQVHLCVSRNSSPNESFHACRCRSRCPTRTKDETCTCAHLACTQCTDAHAAPSSDWRAI